MGIKLLVEIEMVEGSDISLQKNIDFLREIFKKYKGWCVRSMKMIKPAEKEIE